MNSGREAAAKRPATEVMFDEEDLPAEQAPLSTSEPLRWQDRLLWVWPALIIVAMAVGSQWGTVWGLAAGIAGTATVAAVTGWRLVDRRPRVVFLTAASVLLVGVVTLGNLGVLSGTSPRADQLHAGETLDDKHLIGAQLNGTVAPGVSLVRAKLNGANLRGADLSAGDLSGADLRGADLSGANLRAADLSNACLLGANLSGAQLDGANFNGADLSMATVSADAANHVRGWPAPGQKTKAC